MTAQLTTFRLALQDQLQTQLQIEFLPGVLTGPVLDRNVGCVWTAGMAPFDDNALVGQVEVRLRVFQRTPQPLDNPDTVERAQSGLEQLAEDVSAALLAVKYTLAGVWYFRVVAFELDLEENGLEVALLAYRDYPAA